MKIRSDYVTNSSSSSFIISKNDISKEDLFKLLIELANETQWVWDEDDKYEFTSKDFKYDSDESCIHISNFYLREATKDKPYHHYNEWSYLEKYDDIEEYYTDHYIIDNDTCCRYDWNVIEQVLGEYGLDLIYGYCD